MKHTLIVRICETCRRRGREELKRRGLPLKGNAPLSEDASHALVRILCDDCLKAAAILHSLPACDTWERLSADEYWRAVQEARVCGVCKKAGAKGMSVTRGGIVAVCGAECHMAAQEALDAYARTLRETIG